MAALSPVKLSRLASASVGLVVFLLGITLSTVLLLLDYRKAHEEQARIFFTEVESVVEEFRLVLSTLNAQTTGRCDEQTMIAMRRELFLAEHIKDIGFVDNGQVICTTGVGKLDRHVEVGTPDYIGMDGLSVFVDVPLTLFEYQYSALIAFSGDFDAVFDLAVFDLLPGMVNDWEVVYTRDEAPVSVAGEKGLYRGQFAESGYRFSLTSQYSETCLPEYQYCLGVQSDFQSWLDHYRTLYLVFVILWFFIGVLVAFAVQKLIARTQSIESKVRRALRQRAFHNLYQPILDLKSGAMVGCEALARCHLSNEPLYPDQFIPEVARSGQTWRFTKLMIQQGLTELSAETALPDGFRVNFNLFPADIAAAYTRDFAKMSTVANSRFTLVLEVTEDQQLEGKQAQTELEWLKSQGYGVALDDFGTGYSNLNQIRDFQADYLKIDRSFIMDLEDGSIKSSLIPYIVDIARQLNLFVVAEGIENARQWEALRDMGVQYGQGYYFGKPMSAEALVRLYSQQARN